ncbi:MAG: hypothetical protein ABIJ85_01535 [bacterium]
MKNSKNREVKELGIKSIFSFAVNTLLIFFLIILGIETIKIGQLFLGLLYFVFSILILVPHRFFRVTHAFKVVIIVILSIIVVAISGHYAPTKEQKYDHFSVGQAFNLALGFNNFSMVIKEVKHDAKLSTEQKEALTTSGSFIIVTADIVNLGSEAVVFKLGTTPELMDSQDRRYAQLGKGMTVGKLQPGVAKEVPYVYEVPKDALELKFIVRDNSKIAKSVELKK